VQFSWVSGSWTEFFFNFLTCIYQIEGSTVVVSNCLPHLVQKWICSFLETDLFWVAFVSVLRQTCDKMMVWSGSTQYKMWNTKSIFMNLFIECWAGSSSTFDEQIQEKLIISTWATFSISSILGDIFKNVRSC